MIIFKSKLLNATLAVAAALPLASAGLFTSAGSAQAYTGGFTYDGDGTTANILNTGITFNPNPGAIELGSKSGDFSGDTTGTIYSFLNLGLPAKFIDVGLADNIKLFSLTSISGPKFDGVVGGGTEIKFDVYGLFEDGSKAEGYIRFISLLNTEAAQTAYTSGGINNTSFIGLTVASVPEPAALLGLSAVGGVMVMSRRRKSVVQ